MGLDPCVICIHRKDSSLSMCTSLGKFGVDKIRQLLLDSRLHPDDHLL